MFHSIHQDPRMVAAAQDNVRFFSNTCKDDRERWIFEHWCSITGRGAAQGAKGEAPDFILGSEKIEIVEILVVGRKRYQEYQKDLAALRAGSGHSQELIHDGPCLATIQSSAHQWVLDTIRNKHNHYGPTSASWTLLIYANFTFCDRTCWKAVATELLQTPPGFARIEVLLPDGASSLALYPAFLPHQP